MIGDLHFDFNRPIHKETRLCIVEDCNKPVHCGGKYCGKHYTQLRNYKRIKERTIFDKNNITIKGDIAYIDVYDLNNNVKNQIIIDTEDIDKIKDYKWNINTSGYAYCRSISKTIHSIIVGVNEIYKCKNNLEIDHINRNKLDNRKCNLRLVTRSENNVNTKKKGYRLENGFYVVRVKVKGKTVFKASFSKEEYAIEARKRAIKKYYPNL